MYQTFGHQRLQAVLDISNIRPLKVNNLKKVKLRNWCHIVKDRKAWNDMVLEVMVVVPVVEAAAAVVELEN